MSRVNEYSAVEGITFNVNRLCQFVLIEQVTQLCFCIVIMEGKFIRIFSRNEAVIALFLNKSKLFKNNFSHQSTIWLGNDCGLVCRAFSCFCYQRPAVWIQLSDYFIIYIFTVNYWKDKNKRKKPSGMAPLKQNKFVND